MKIVTLTFKAISVIVLGLCMLSPTQAQSETQQQGGPPVPPSTVRKAGGVLQGTATRRVTPAYPPLAKAARISGSVVVEVTVDEEGNVMSARALSGHPLLKDSSVAAARGWKFTPTTLSGEPVKVIGTITFNFTPPSDEDIERAKEEVNANPDSADAHLNLGEAYLLMVNRNEEAAAAFEKAVSLNPQSARAHRSLAQAYTRLGRREDAIKHLKEAISLDPDNIGQYIKLGGLYQSLERDEDAIEIYRQALSRNPNGEDAERLYTTIGFSNLNRGRYQEALEAFNRAITFTPLSTTSSFVSDAYMGLCMTYIKLGDKRAALSLYESVKGVNPTIAEEMLEQINKKP